MAQIRLDQVGKVYPGGVTAVDGLSLDIADGEFMVFVGPSGCGKSTALRMIAGLEDITGGTISIGGALMNAVAAKDRDIAMVFQNYALYPHMTVAQNLAFALQTRRVPRAEITQRVDRVARMLGLAELMDRKPGALSGGQRQRVAMGRAIVREPRVFLMDEPLSNLDAKLRVSMRASLAQLHERLGVTTVYVTHDQTEAMTLGDRVCVLRDGVLQQVDTPQNLFGQPANLFVACFIGSPAMNLATARLERDGSGAAVSFAGHRLPVPAELLEARPALAGYTGGEVILGARPSDFEDAGLAAPDWARMAVTADLTEALGSEIHVMFSLPAPPVRHPDLAALSAAGGDGDGTGVALDPGGTLWTARVSARSKITPGTRAELAVDTAALYFFDPASGTAIAR